MLENAKDMVMAAGALLCRLATISVLMELSCTVARCSLGRDEVSGGRAEEKFHSSSSAAAGAAAAAGGAGDAAGLGVLKKAKGSDAGCCCCWFG